MVQALAMAPVSRAFQLLICFCIHTVYSQTDVGPQVSISADIPGPPFPAAVWIDLSCDVNSSLSVTYEWTGHCTAQGSDQVVFRYPEDNIAENFNQSDLRIRSTPTTCLDTIECTATDENGNVGEASFNITDVTGVGLFGTSQPISNNSAFVANATGQIGIIFCHSASRDGHIGRWISPDGRNITSDSNDVFQISFFSGPHPSYTTLQLAEGSTFTAAEQGIYSCVIPDEMGAEQTLNVGIYPDANSANFRNPSIRSISENPTVISCTTSGLPLTSVTFRQLNPTEAVSTSPSFLQNRSTSTYSSFLTVNTSGLFTCFPRSAFFIHQSDEILSHTTSPEPSEFRESVIHFVIATIEETKQIGCEVGGNATLLEWLRDDEVILSAPNSPNSVLGLELVFNDSIHHQIYTCRGFDANSIVIDEIDVTAIVQVPESALAVTVQTSEDGSLGERHTLTCNASETVEGLTNRATAQWLDQDGNVINNTEGIVVDGPSIQSTVTVISLIFDPLKASHAGNYTCQATLSSPALSLPLVKTAQTNVTVQAPTPGVSITPPSGPLYAGSTVTLICLIQVDELVNIQVNVPVTWTVTTESGDQITNSNALQIASHTYQTALIISLLRRTLDTGDYTCTASVSPNPPSPFIAASSEASDTHSITTIEAPFLTVSIDPPNGIIIIGSEFSLTCTASAPDGVTVSKVFRWTRTLGSTTTQLTDNGDSVRITNNNLNSPTSTSVLTVREDTAGIYTYQCTSTIQIPDDPNISMVSNAVQVTVTATPSTTLNTPTMPQSPSPSSTHLPNTTTMPESLDDPFLWIDFSLRAIPSATFLLNTPTMPQSPSPSSTHLPNTTTIPQSRSDESTGLTIIAAITVAAFFSVLLISLITVALCCYKWRKSFCKGKATTEDEIDMRINHAYIEFSGKHSTIESNTKPLSPTYCSIEDISMETIRIYDEPRFGDVQGHNHQLSQELQYRSQFVACGSGSEKGSSDPRTTDSQSLSSDIQSVSCEPRGCEQFQTSGAVSVESPHEQPQSYEQPELAQCSEHPEGCEESQVYERTEGYKRWKDYDRTGSYECCQDYETVGNYERCQDYEMTGRYERCQDYEMTGRYERCQDYEMTGHYERCQDYEKPQEYEKVQDYEKPQEYEKVQDYEKPQEYEKIQDYETPQTYERFPIQ